MEYRVPLTEIPWHIALLALPAKIFGVFHKHHMKMLKGILVIITAFVLFLLVLEGAHMLSDKPGPIKQIWPSLVEPSDETNTLP